MSLSRRLYSANTEAINDAANLRERLHTIISPGGGVRPEPKPKQDKLQVRYQRLKKVTGTSRLKFDDKQTVR